MRSVKVVVRAWFKRECDVVLDAGHTDALSRLLTASDAAMPAFTRAGVDVRCYGDDVFVVPLASARDPRLPCAWTPEHALRLSHGTLQATRVRGAGLACNRIATRLVTVRYRRRGERVEFGQKRHHRPLNKQFQHWRLPPWERDRLPLVCVDDEVACVPGYKTVGSFAAATDEDGWMVSWDGSEQ